MISKEENLKNLLMGLMIHYDISPSEADKLMKDIDKPPRSELPIDKIGYAVKDCLKYGWSLEDFQSSARLFWEMKASTPAENDWQERVRV